MKPWITLSRRVAYQVKRFLTVEHHSVQLPDGRIINDWTWLSMPEYANILARTHNGKFLFFRQTKYAFPSPVLAPPGGYLEPGEIPLDAAKRELLEETGYTADTWHSLGSYVMDANRGAGKAHLFLALGAKQTATPIADDLEEQHLLLLTRRELEDALDQGLIAMIGWAALLSLAFRKIDRTEK
jgi:ADP-ribose pyrophosphatase